MTVFLANKLIQTTFLIILSGLVFIGVSFLGSVSFFTKQLIGIPVYYLLTYSILSKKILLENKIKLIIIGLPLIVTLLVVNILSFSRAWISFPSNLFLLLSCLLSYLFSRTHFLKGLIILIILPLVWNLFFNDYLINKMYYGSFSKKIVKKIPTIQLYDSNSNLINIENSNKIFILDFWNSKCAPCFRLFPIIDSVNKIIDKSRFEIAVVNIPILEETMPSNVGLLNKFDYSFNKYFMKDDNSLPILGIKVFPTTIIIKSDSILYRGDFLSAIESVK